MPDDLFFAQMVQLVLIAILWLKVYATNKRIDRFMDALTKR